MPRISVTQSLSRRSNSVRRMVAMVEEGTEILRHGDLNDFGHLLHEAWELKRGLSDKISSHEIDELYDRARQEGAIGGKLLGAGSTGFMLLFVPQERQPAVLAALTPQCVNVPVRARPRGRQRHLPGQRPAAVPMTVKPETVFRTPWFEIGVVDPGPEASGTTDPYYCLIRPNGVIAFLLDREGRVVLVEQYRPPLGRTTLEMPAGNLDEGETPDQAVAREVLEETGLVCRRWYQISQCRLLLHRENVIDYFYVGLGAQKAADHQAGERGTVRFLHRHRFLELVKTRQFEQTAALGGLYLVEKIFGVDPLADDIEAIEAGLDGGHRWDARVEHDPDRTGPDQQQLFRSELPAVFDRLPAGLCAEQAAGGPVHLPADDLQADADLRRSWTG